MQSSASHPSTSTPHPPPLALPPYSLRLPPSTQERISSSTPFRFHQPFPSQDPSFLEPFIPLSESESESTPNLILTPPRLTDLIPQVECLNDPKVGLQLLGPPYPYTEEMGKDWNEMRWRDTLGYFDGLSKQLRVDDDDLKGEKEKEKEKEVSLMKWKDGVPFASIRNRETGEWVGEIGICRWEFRDIEDEREGERLRKENEEREIGDKDLVWSFGYYLSTRFQGQGLTTLTLRAVFSKIFIDYLNAGIVRASAFVDNEASIRVQEKCGLKKLRGVDGEEKRFWHEVSEGRGGGRRQEVVLEWRRDRDVK